MRSIVAMVILGSILLMSASAVAADETQHRLTPPSRPLPVSSAQFEALQQLSSQSEHVWVTDARASYSPETARKMTEAGVIATNVGIPATILGFLIAAAPL